MSGHEDEDEVTRAVLDLATVRCLKVLVVVIAGVVAFVAALEVARLCGVSL